MKATEQPIDPSTAAGKCFLDMLGVFAEFETNLRRERQMEGIAKVKADGVYAGRGRPASVDVEQVRAMKEIWTKDVAEFHGEHVNFEPIWCWPKPAQQPHPPVLLGGESSYTLQRIVDYCEGWFPRSRNPELVTKAMAELKDRAAKAGRDMQTISVSVFGAPGDQQLVDTYRDIGATRVILRLPSEGRDTILPMLDQYAKFLQ